MLSFTTAAHRCRSPLPLTTASQVASLLSERQSVDDDFEAASGRHGAAEDEVKGHEKEKAGLSRKSTELERKVVQLQQQSEGKNPAFIKLREEVSHVQKRRLMHEKSLGKVKGTLTLTLTLTPTPTPTLTLALTLALALALALA